MSAYRYRVHLGSRVETVLSAFPLSRGAVISVRGREDLWKVEGLDRTEGGCYLAVESFYPVTVVVEEES